jgi:hypothetical protein
MEELIRIHYAPQAQSAVRAILLAYAAAGCGPITDRVQFDLLHLGAGDPDRVKRLTDRLGDLRPAHVWLQHLTSSLERTFIQPVSPRAGCAWLRGRDGSW